MIVKLYKQDIVNKDGEVKGEEIVTRNCPRFMASVNTKKSCSKCPMKNKLSYSKMELDCKMMK